jgi:hypothetical protein
MLSPCLGDSYLAMDVPLTIQSNIQSFGQLYFVSPKVYYSINKRSRQKYIKEKCDIKYVPCIGCFTTLKGKEYSS